MTDDQKFGLALCVLWGGAMVIAIIAAGLAHLKDRFGTLPRGFRWMARVWPASKSGIRRGLLRVFYPEVARQERDERVGYIRPTLDKESAR